MIRAETGKARLARARDAVSRQMSPPDLGDQEDTIALTGNRTADEVLRAVDLRRVDQRHPERQACAQRFFFGGLRMSSLSKARRPLAECRDDRAIAELDRPACGRSGRPAPEAAFRQHRRERQIVPATAKRPVLNSRRFRGRLLISPDNAGTLRY